MPFLRYSRDKRGYEHVYLVQPIGRRGKIRPRILYWYRTPPGVKVGRDPFDEEVRRTIEAQYPDVEFDWPKLIATPKPPPQADVERWRERRRQAKAERAAAAAPRADNEPADVDEPENGELEPSLEADVAELTDDVGDLTEALVEAEAPIAPIVAPAPTDSAMLAAPERKRKRRRRRRRKPGGGDPGAVGELHPAAPYAGGEDEDEPFEPPMIESSGAEDPSHPAVEDTAPAPEPRVDQPPSRSDE